MSPTAMTQNIGYLQLMSVSIDQCWSKFYRGAEPCFQMSSCDMKRMLQTLCFWWGNAWNTSQQHWTQ